VGIVIVSYKELFAGIFPTNGHVDSHLNTISLRTQGGGLDPAGQEFGGQLVAVDPGDDGTAVQ
jgi:hypothetical protein